MANEKRLIELLKGIKYTVFPNSTDLYSFGTQHSDHVFQQVADNLIANGVNFATDNNVGSKWIPVTERLPKEWEEVLVWSYCGFCEVAVYLGIKGKWRVTWNHDLLEEDTVTHWMPLPEPPKEEENE